MAYVSVKTDEILGHLKRHAFESETIGSHFNLGHDQFMSLVDRVDMLLESLHNTSFESGQSLGRIELKIDMGFPIGNQALIELPSDKEGSVFKISRDKDSKEIVNGVLSLPEDIPTTSMVTVIAGSYGSTGKWGIYTMFPGDDSGKPFPNEKQTFEDQAKYKEYWDMHGFLVTPEQAQKFVDREKKGYSDFSEKLNRAQGDALTSVFKDSYFQSLKYDGLYSLVADVKKALTQFLNKPVNTGNDSLPTRDPL